MSQRQRDTKQNMSALTSTSYSETLGERRKRRRTEEKSYTEQSHTK